jgi:hypothetical protein
MLRFINIMFQMVLPIFITFHVLPKVWKMIFGQDEEEPKKKSKPRQLGHRNPPPPPPKRLLKERERLAKQLENYEVIGGRIVKKEMDTPRYARVKTLPDTPKKNKFKKGVDPDFL